ncbi:AF4/FMR2 family member 4 [Trichinella murrelli]|uniref:AF4/FMR2 family member lilli n=1 Tax=Trichinella murrelli TaxID=144512 RepID=A0A0V0U306_9BILA|nr:AF4/FMR2 family member 4 [Trichinella murrelli]
MKKIISSSLQMQEREALRRQAEEARRSGVAKVASKPQEHLSCAPVFDPPIRVRDNDEDSLHVRLKRSLGSFEEVSRYLFNGMRLPGVDCRPVQSGNDSSFVNGIQNSQAEANSQYACETYKNGPQRPPKPPSSTSRGKSSTGTSPVVKSLKNSPTKNGSKHHNNHIHHANPTSSNTTSKHCTDADPLSGCLDDLSHCPLEVATLIKKVQEMIPAPLTAISTPRKERKCDFKKNEQQQHLNGYSSTEEQQHCNGVASKQATIFASNADYYYDQQQQQAVKTTTVIDAFGKKSLSTTTSNNVELVENSLKRESSFSVLNRDLELSEDSDSDSEDSDDSTSSTKLSDTVLGKVESLSESEQRRCTTATTSNITAAAATTTTTTNTTTAAAAAVANTTSTTTTTTTTINKKNNNTGSKNMLESSPFSEAGSETKEESNEAPENPWDIDYLISKILFPKVPGSENGQLMNGGLLSPIPPNHHCNGNKAMDEDDLEEEEVDAIGADVKEKIDSLFEEKKKNVGKVRKKNKADTTPDKGSLLSPAGKSKKRSKVAAKVENADEMVAGEQVKVQEKFNNFQIPSKVKRKSSKCNKLNNEELSNVKCENDSKQITVATTATLHNNNNSSNSVVVQSRTTNVVDTILKEINLPAPLSPIRDLNKHPKQNNKKKSLKCLLDLQLVRKVPTPVFEKAKQCGIDLKLEKKSDNVKIKKDPLKHSKPTDHKPTSKEHNCCTDGFEAKTVEKRNYNHTTHTTTTTTTNNSSSNTGTVDDFPKIRTELDEKFMKERVQRTLECLKRSSSSSVAVVDSKRDTPLTNGVVPVKHSSSTTQAKNVVGTEETATTTATVVKRPTPPVTSGTVNHQSAKNQVDSPKRKATSKIEQAEITPAKKSRTDNFMQNCLAAAPLLPFKLKYDDTVDPTKYLQEAKTVKHSADAEFGCRIIQTVRNVQRNWRLVEAKKYLAQASLSTDPYVKFLAPKVEVLTLRIQAVLCRRLFELRQPQVFNNYRHINQYQQQMAKDGNRQCCSGNPYTGNNSQVSEQHLAPACSGAGGGGGGTVVMINNNSSRSCQPSPCRPPSACTHSPTPSPASSTGSAHSLPPGLVAIPQNVENLYKQQLSHLHNLMWSHHYWLLIEKKLNTQHGQFFSHVDSVCGALNFTCSIQELCVSVLTSVHWLRQFHLACQQKTFSNGFN